MSDVRSNCLRVLERIQKAAHRCGRDTRSIRLIAVTKTVPADRVRQAVECGIRDFGESRLQESLPKIQELGELRLTWHFIGHLQTNKAKKVLEHFHWIHSVDRQELAEKLDQQASQPLAVLIEVKLHEEPNKSGVDETVLPQLVEQFQAYKNLQLRGLMAIPPFFENVEDSRVYFRKLRDLAARFTLPELSMGMSHDFEVAVEEGATMVRVGSALFGDRG